LRGSIYPEEFGALSAVNSLNSLQGAIDASYNYGLKFAIDKSFLFSGRLNIPDIEFVGSGKLVGDSYPSVNRALVKSSSTREGDIKSIVNSEVHFSLVSHNVYGELSIESALVTGGGNNLIVLGRLSLVNCVVLGIGLKAYRSGCIFAPGVSVIESSNVGIHAHLGGVVEASDALVVAPGHRGCYVQNGGVIDVPGIDIFQSGDDGLAILYSGSINASGENSRVIDSAGYGAVVNYGGSINLNAATVGGSQKSNITCESNGSVFAKHAVLYGSLSSGITTSFGGVINAEGAQIYDNAQFDVYALGSGFINIKDAYISDGEIGLAVKIRAIGDGVIFSELPGVALTAKSNLATHNYSPGYNSLGNGAAYIGEFSQDDASVHCPRLIIPEGAELVISDGAILVSRSYHSIDTGANVDAEDLLTINGGEDGMRLLIQAAHSARTVVVKDAVGNLRLSADMVLDHENDSIELLYFSVSGIWKEISRSGNN